MPQTAPSTATLILISALSILSLNMFLPSLPAMAEAFDVSYAVINLTVSGFFIVTAVLQLIIGPLSDRFGRRPILLIGLILFTIASCIATFADHLAVLLAARLVQGAVIVGSVISRAVVRDLYPPQEAAGTLGQIGMVMALAPMLGPLFGGVLDAVFGWRASFAAFAIMGIGTLLLCWFDLGETHTKRAPTFLAQFRTYPALLGAPLFWAHSLCLTFAVGAFFVFLSGAPLVVQPVFGLGSAGIGAVLGSITGGFAFGNFLSSRYATRYRLSTMMIAGRLVATGGMTVGIIGFAIGIESLWLFIPCVMSVGLGNGLTLPAGNAGALSVKPELAGSAAGMSGSLQVAGGALFTSIAGVVLARFSSPTALMGLMLALILAGLAMALWVRIMEHAAD